LAAFGKPLMAQIQTTTLVQMILNAVNDLKDLTHPKGFPLITL
jgi:hypothetical protein